MKRVVWMLPLLVAGCGVANHYPPVGFMDAPAIEFRNAEGVGRWCNSPQAAGAFAEANFRSCRDGLLAEGYREIGPWCGGAAPTAGESAAAAVLGGIPGLLAANNRSAHYAACEQRQPSQ